MLAQVLQDAIDDNLSQIYQETPLDDIIYKLHANKVLSEEEVDILIKYSSKKRQIYEFIKILRTRDDEDYEKFCKALIEHNDPAVINLGKKLRTSSNPDEAAFNIVYENIGTDWSKLVTYLDATIDTSKIRRQNQYNVFDQGKEALILWSKKHPADATIEKLKEALQAIGRNDIRDAIEKSNK